MARKATGAVVAHVAADGNTYRSLRFTAYGKRRFVSLGAVSEAEAQRRLRHVMADVERGVWQPPQAVEPPIEPEPIPTFDEYAADWWLRNRGQFRPSTIADYTWRLQKHILPTFGPMPLDRISYDAVERYIATKLEEGLSPRSVNMMVTLVAQILEGAVERDMIRKNPASGKDRRAREPKPRRTYLDSARSIEALLDAAGAMDRAAVRGQGDHIHRRALLATLLFGGLRINELCDLRWRDVDLAGGWLHVDHSKTDAGVRRVKLRGALRDELAAIRPLDAPAAALVFGTRTGGKQNPTNIRMRILTPAVERANATLAAEGFSPLPERLTPHSLRRTFASVLFAIGEPHPVVMSEMGHTQPSMTLGLYAQVMRVDDRERQRLKDLIEGARPDAHLAVIGSRAGLETAA
jgi:integrase